MPLINCEIILQLAWSTNCIITNSTGIGILAITNARFMFHYNSVNSRKYKTITIAKIEFRVLKSNQGEQISNKEFKSKIRSESRLPGLSKFLRSQQIFCVIV